MFIIPEDQLPDFLKDEEKLSVLFAPLRSRSVNSRDWENKISSWKKVIFLYCKNNDKYSFTLSELNKVFVRNSRPPVCLDEVIKEMLKTGDLQIIGEFFKSKSVSWSEWATNNFVTKPLSWSFNKLKTTIFTINENGTYINKEVVKLKSMELLNSISNNHKNKIVSVSELLKLLGKDVEYTENLKILLHYLSNEDKIETKIIKLNPISEETDCLIKFGDGNKVKPINEMDIGIYTLEKNERLLLHSVESLEEEIDKLIKEAQTHLAKKHRQMAKTCLRKKKEIEKRLDKKANALHNVQVLLERIKDSESDAHVWESYKQAVKTFDSTLKTTGLSEDAVEDTMLKLGEMLEIHDDIEASLARPTADATATDSDLEAELADLMKADVEERNLSAELAQNMDNLNLNLSKDLPNVPDISPNVSIEESTLTQ